MSLFTSARERRLWFWTLVVLVAIYSTLGLATTLAGALRDRDLISTAFWIGLFLVGAAVVVQGLRSRPRGAEIGIALGVAGAYLIAFLRMASPEELSPLIEYSVVALLIHEAFLERVSQGRRVPVPALLALIVTAPESDHAEDRPKSAGQLQASHAKRMHRSDLRPQCRPGKDHRLFDAPHRYGCICQSDSATRSAYPAVNKYMPLSPAQVRSPSVMK